MVQFDETFFTSVGCMDGRVQDVVAAFGRQKFDAKYADTITEAGIVGLLSKENIDQNLLDALKFKIVDVSIRKHHSKGIIVHGHAECAGNPVEDEKQKDDIRKAVTIIAEIVVGGVPVVGVFAGRLQKDPSRWEIKELP